MSATIIFDSQDYARRRIAAQREESPPETELRFIGSPRFPPQPPAQRDIRRRGP